VSGAREQLASEKASAGEALSPLFTIACLLLLQAVYIDIEDMLGGRQAKAFEKDIIQVFKNGSFPQTDSPKAVKELLTADPLNNLQIPPWQEAHLNKLLQDMHGLGHAYLAITVLPQRLRYWRIWRQAIGLSFWLG